LDLIYNQYMDANAEFRKKLSKKARTQERKIFAIPEDLSNFSKFAIMHEAEDELEMYDEEPDNELLIAPANEAASQRASIWFDSDLFNDIEGENEDEEAINKLLQERQEKLKKRKRNALLAEADADLDTDSTISKSNLPIKKRKVGPEAFVPVHADPDGNDDLGDKEKTPKKGKSDAGYNSEAEFEEVPAPEYMEEDFDEMDETKRAEMLALGTLLKDPTMRNEVVDKSLNRYIYADDGHLPEWFVDDESKHNKPQVPVTKEMVAQYKEDMKAIDARSTKKVAEAKARKKKQYLLKLDKARKKAKSIVANSEIGERDKVKQIQKLYKGQLAKVKPQKVYVVGRKKVMSNKIPKGRNVRMKLVDPRLKKDKRANKARDERNKTRSKK